MYAKLFTSIYQGTLRGNSHGLLVFTNMLAHADRHGIVDIHQRAIAEEVGLTRDQVQVAIDELEAPDPESRSPEEGGRRIIRTDEHRSWGWLVVNYAKYSAIRSAEDRRDQNRLAQEKWRAKQTASKQRKPASATISHDQPEKAHIDVDVDLKTKALVRPVGPHDPDGFSEFWKAWPNTARRVGRKACAAKWVRSDHGKSLATILAHVEALKASKQWRDGFEPSPLTYLNQERWGDGLPGELHLVNEPGYI